MKWLTLREICPYPELFRLNAENNDQSNSIYGHFLRSEITWFPFVSANTARSLFLIEENENHLANPIHSFWEK